MTRQLWVFGSNGEGQLGIPAADIVITPTRVENPPPLEELISIKFGDNHTLSQNKYGPIYGVGDNRKGQLANQLNGETRFERFQSLQKGGSFVAATCESSAIISLKSTTSPTQFAAGFGGKFAEVGTGENVSWIHTEGSSQWGELGRGEDVSSTADQNTSSIADIGPFPGSAIDFAAGVWHYVAVFDDGTVYGWGKARLGQLGDQLAGKVTVPTKIDDISFLPKKVVCGKDFTYLIGDSTSGEHILLGKDKFSILSGMPHNVKGWKDIGATWHAVFVLFEDGTLIAWGKENMWQLLPPNLPPIDKIAVGSDHILALTEAGRLISWGWGKHGNCGDLSVLGDKVKNDMVSGFWNEIGLPGRVETIAAGFCTSFVVIVEGGDGAAQDHDDI